MYRFHAAYLHDDGAVEGFIGYGFSPDAAEANAINQIREKVCGQPGAFERGRVVRDACRISPEQLQQVLRDWRDILKAKRAAGHSVI